MNIDRIDSSENCPDANTLAAYTAGTLSGAECETFEAHLQDCDACRDECDAVDALLAEPLAVVPAEVLLRAQLAATPDQVKVRRANFAARAGSWAAVIAIMALGGALGCFMGVKTAANPQLGSATSVSSLFGELGNVGDDAALPRTADQGGAR